MGCIKDSENRLLMDAWRNLLSSLIILILALFGLVIASVLNQVYLVQDNSIIMIVLMAIEIILLFILIISVLIFFYSVFDIVVLGLNLGKKNQNGKEN